MAEKKLTVCFVGFDPRSDKSYGNIIRNICLGLKDPTVGSAETGASSKRLVSEGAESESTDDYSPRQIEIITLGTGSGGADRHPNLPWRHIQNEGLDGADRVDGYATFIKYYDSIKPDVVILVDDAYNMGRWADSKLRKHFTLIMYPVVDGIPFQYKHIISKADHLVFYTQQSAESCRDVISEIPYDIIPAGVDASTYKPIEVKGRQGKDFALNLLFVGNNQLRKHNWQLLEIIGRAVHGKYTICTDCGRVVPQSYCARPNHAVYKNPLDYECLVDWCPYCGSNTLTDGEPLNVSLWMHTFISPIRYPIQWEMRKLIRTYGVHDAVMFTSGFTSHDKTLSEEEMNVLYNSSDALLYISGGEGFGMPVLEAALAGLPIIYSDYSVHSELIRENEIPSWRVPVTTLLPNLKDSVFRGLVDTFQAVEVIRKVIEEKNLFKQKLLEKRDYLVAKYDWKVLAGKWLKVILKAKRKQRSKGPIVI